MIPARRELKYMNQSGFALTELESVSHDEENSYKKRNLSIFPSIARKIISIFDCVFHENEEANRIKK